MYLFLKSSMWKNNIVTLGFDETTSVRGQDSSEDDEISNNDGESDDSDAELDGQN